MRKGERLPEERRNLFKKLDAELKPRELMERTENPADMADDALLGILLRTGTNGVDVRELGRRLIDAFGGLKHLLASDWRGIERRIVAHNEKARTDSRLKPIKGIGHVKCLELAAAFEMGKRWARLSPDEVRETVVDDPSTAVRLFRGIMRPDDEYEHLYVLLLGPRNQPICEPVMVSTGMEWFAVVSARRVYKEALKWGAAKIIVAHNHPSGDPTPSDADVEFTRQIKELSALAEVEFLDHIVIGSLRSMGGRGFVSLKEYLGDCPGAE